MKKTGRPGGRDTRPSSFSERGERSPRRHPADRRGHDAPHSHDDGRGARREAYAPRGDRPHGDRPYGDRPREDRPRSDRPYSDRPREDRPRSDRPYGDRPREDRPRSDRPYGDRPREDRPRGDRPYGDRPREDRPRGDRPYGDRPREDRPRGDRPYGERSAGDSPRDAHPRSARAFRDRDARDTERDSGARADKFDKPLRKDNMNVWRPAGEEQPDPRGPRFDAPRRDDDRPPRRFDERGERSERPRREDRFREDRPREDRGNFRGQPYGDRPREDRFRDDRAPRADADRPRPAPELDENGEPISSKPQNAQRSDETRIYGLNACLGMFAKRPQDLIRAYFSQRVLSRCNDIMRFCVENRLAYHIIPDEELNRVADTQHHEGVCLLVKKRLTLRDNEFLGQLAAGESCTVLALEGIGNPHNLGAIARTAAHFGVKALLVPETAPIHAGAAARIAEGGLESLPLVTFRDLAQSLQHFHAEGFQWVATSSHESESLFDYQWPKRSVILFGEEGEGLSRFALEEADARVSIPGTGAVESLNVSCATAVVLAEWSRQQAGSKRKGK